MIHQLRRQHPHLPGRPPLPPKTAAAQRVPLWVGGRVRTMAAVLIDPNGASEPTSQLPPGGCCDDHLNPPTDGIPLFVEEMTKAVLEAASEDAIRRTVAAMPSPVRAVPASLQASLMARLDRLG